MNIRSCTFVTIISLIAVFGLLACGESDEERELREAREWAIHTLSEGETPPPKAKPLPSDLDVDIPEGLTERYPTVKMKVYTYETDSYESFTVDVPGKAKVPGTGYTIEVLNYMPAWSIKDRVLTIKPAEEARPDPAIRAVITNSDGKQVFNGFIFQLHKTPSFKTDKHVIGLVGVVDTQKEDAK